MALTPLAPPVARVRREVPPWTWRVQSMLGSYLPLLLMSFLAIGTWWLVKNTPQNNGPQEAVALRHVPDYRMQQFEMRRMGADGMLRARIEGAKLRHYPDNDTIEIDQVRVQVISPDGALTIATADRALANGDLSQTQLIGNVLVRRFDAKQNTETDKPTLVLRSDFVQAESDAQILRSHLPAVIEAEGGELHLQGGFVYDHLHGTLRFSGRSQGQFMPRAQR